MLEIKDVSLKVRGGSRANILDHISLRIKPGTLAVITGPNGSGKSTLAEIIMGIKTPTSGKILFNESDITTQSITDRAKAGIAYSFQQPVHLRGIDVYTLLNIASGELITPETATQYLVRVGLDSNYLSREISNKLSGGELKRIEIASVLARHPKLIIFDEPEAGIDLWSINHLTKVFKRLKADGVTTIIISHQEKILNLADEIIILENGKIKNQGSKARILPALTGGKNGTD